MKRKLLISALALILVLVLAGCGCKHEWEDATCKDPKTCSECGKTKGEALGHKWQDATCTTPKTCSVCKATEGNPLDHTWQEATCSSPKTCSACKITEGTVIAHTWEEATTEAPKTCTVCKSTEGEKLKVEDSRFTTAATKELHGTWHSELNMTAQMMGLDKGFENGIDAIMTITFGKTGEMAIGMKVKDEKAFIEDFKAYTLLVLYDTFQKQGLNKAQTDQLIQANYDMTTEEYVEAEVKKQDINAIFNSYKDEGVYYVKDGRFYMGEKWTGSFQNSAFSVKDGVLVIDEMKNIDGTAAMQWKKAA